MFSHFARELLSNNETTLLRRINLKTLDPSIFNAQIIGIIIAKQEARVFVDAKSSENGSSRAVINFTFRDSPQDFINVTYWGKTENILKIDENFHVGDVVELMKPQILIRKYNDHGEQFRPKVTSPYSLTMNDNVSNIVHHNGMLAKQLKDLLRIPTKPPGFIPIRDIHNGGLAMKDTLVDVLGAIAFVGSVRNVKLKNGTEAPLVEIMLFDQTNPGLRVTLWNKDYIKQSISWTPRNTILFITDLKVDWSGYHKSVVAKFTNRTILTVNPIGREAQTLAQYAQDAPLQTPAFLDQLANSFPNVEMIQNVMSVQQIQNKLKLTPGPGQNIQFGALMYAVITQFDLDGFGRLFNRKCGNCKTLLKNPDPFVKCDNPNCLVSQNLDFTEPELSFDIRMTLSDHTGCLEDCKLSGRAAEKVLGCTVNDFLQMSDEERGKLKWKFLLERCALRLIVFSINNQRAIISVQDCYLPDSIEIAQRIPVY